MPDTQCTICRADYPYAGQQTHSPWLLWGSTFRICRWCVEAGRDSRRKREHEHKANIAKLTE